MKEFFTEFVPGALTIVAMVISLTLAAAWLVVYVEVDTMRKLGHEAKQVNFDCVIKVEHKWVPCRWVKYDLYK